jgi:hypothetical protein
MALCSPLFCEQSSDEQNELKILDINKRPMSAKIATPEIEHHCYNVVDSLLKPIGLTFDTICPYLRNAIVEIITDTTKKWTAQALRNKQKTVDRYLVTDDITKQVLPLLVNPPDIVNAVNVTIKIDDHFENICLEKDLDIDQIPTEMLPELATLKQQTKTKALVLINRKADRAISCQDLYGIVATTLSNFVERVKYVLILQWASQLVADTEKVTRENPSSSLVHTQETDKLFGSMRFFKKSL